MINLKTNGLSIVPSHNLNALKISIQITIAKQVSVLKTIKSITFTEMDHLLI